MVEGARAKQLRDYQLAGTRDPLATDDTSAGYSNGDVWINTSSGEHFLLTDATTGAAVWSRVPTVWMVTTANVIDDSLTAPPGSPREQDAYVIAATHTGGWSTFSQGDLVIWTGSAWTKLSSGSGGKPATNLRVIVTAYQGTAAGSFAGNGQKIATYDGTAWRFVAPVAGWTFSVTGNGDILEGSRGVYLASASKWKITLVGARSVSSAADDTVATGPTTDTLVDSMTVTPMAGTYDIEFVSSAESSSGTRNFFFSIYAGGSQVAASEVRFQTPNGTPYAFACIARGVVVDGTQAIEGRWRASSTNGGVIHQRTLSYRKVA